MSQENAPKKVVFLGPPKTGKTSLIHSLLHTEKTFAEFRKTLKPTEIFNDHLCKFNELQWQLWDTASLEGSRENNREILAKSDAVVIVMDLDFTFIDESKSVITSVIKGLLDDINSAELAENAIIFFVFNQWDLAEAFVGQKKYADEPALKIDIEYPIEQARKTFSELSFHPDFIYYSAKDNFNKEKKENNLLQALQNHFSPPVKTMVNHIIESPRFTFANFLKLFLLFAMVTVLCLTLGDIIGAAEGIWNNTDAFFEAIRSLSDWGIGVIAASGGLALVMTSVLGYFTYRKVETTVESNELNSLMDEYNASYTSGVNYRTQVTSKDLFDPPPSTEMQSEPEVEPEPEVEVEVEGMGRQTK